ncbi:MAG: NADH-quinone oxidoreductase subunit NuoE [Rhizobiales bacterium]|nr:NADH-quinone oxidoreductase subunit NuoE [Hyphomicrobiales bacterium]
MSVRRLDPVQPESFAFNRDNLSWAKATIKKYPEGKQASAVIPLLWRAQEQNKGWLPKPAMEYVGDMLGMSYIRVYEVATFYTMFQLSPVGKKAHIQVCGTTPCMLRGAEDLKKVCQHKIHHDPHHLSADGKFSWEEVECLGACVNAPMVQIWKDTYEDLTPESFEKLIDDIAAGHEVKPGPQNGRQFSAPEGKLTSLTDKSLYGRDRTYKRVEAAPPPPAPVAAASAAPKVEAPAKPVTIAETTPSKPKPAKVAAAKVVKEKPAEPRPELFKKPRTGKGDDLKLVWGVGPALEKMLNKMGIWHFDQIASWSAKELAWVDERLEGFKGRAKRDDWVKQAKKLAKGWRPDSAVGERPKK